MPTLIYDKATPTQPPVAGPSTGPTPDITINDNRSGITESISSLFT